MIDAKVVSEREGGTPEGNHILASGTTIDIAQEVAYIAVSIYTMMEEKAAEGAYHFKEMLRAILNDDDAWETLKDDDDQCQVIDFEEMKRKMGR